MGIKSIRFTEKEEKILSFLKKKLKLQNTSQVVKEAILNLYEEAVDREFIEDYEKRKKLGPVEYLSAEEILKQMSDNTN